MESAASQFDSLGGQWTVPLLNQCLEVYLNPPQPIKAAEVWNRFEARHLQPDRDSYRTTMGVYLRAADDHSLAQVEVLYFAMQHVTDASTGLPMRFRVGDCEPRDGCKGSQTKRRDQQMGKQEEEVSRGSTEESGHGDPTGHCHTVSKSTGRPDSNIVHQGSCTATPLFDRARSVEESFADVGCPMDRSLFSTSAFSAVLVLVEGRLAKKVLEEFSHHGLKPDVTSHCWVVVAYLRSHSPKKDFEGVDQVDQEDRHQADQEDLEQQWSALQSMPLQQVHGADVAAVLISGRGKEVVEKWKQRIRCTSKMLTPELQAAQCSPSATSSALLVALPARLSEEHRASVARRLLPSLTAPDVSTCRRAHSASRLQVVCGTQQYSPISVRSTTVSRGADRRAIPGGQRAGVVATNSVGRREKCSRAAREPPVKGRSAWSNHR